MTMENFNCTGLFSVGWNAPPVDLLIAFFYDCVFLFGTIIDIVRICVCLLSQVTVLTVTLVSFAVSKSLGCTTNVALFFIRGILGLEEKPANAFCWLVLLLVLFLYCNHQYVSVITSLHGTGSAYSLSNPPRLQRFYQLISTNHVRRVTQQDLQYEHHLNGNATQHRQADEVDVDDIFQEAQNILNENEENFMVEADRVRVLNDNRRNIARENGADDQRASLENQQNVETESHNAQIILDNHRNRTQERHQYFLRDRRNVLNINSQFAVHHIAGTEQNNLFEEADDVSSQSHLLRGGHSSVQNGEFRQQRLASPIREGGSMSSQF